MAAKTNHSRGRAALGKKLVVSLCCTLGFASLLLSLAPRSAAPKDPNLTIRGVTISCQTWGWEWGTPEFAQELLDLQSIGANWVAIHPYARIQEDGSVGWRAFDPGAPPDWLVGPIRDAKARGMGLLVKPHLAYWGSPFSWRGEIAFDDDAARERFWTSYTEWIVALARVTSGADAFAVGTELDRMLGEENEEQWRQLIESVRAVSNSKLTYAANWTDFERVPFWDALDAVGVQAYFPLIAPLPQAQGGESGEAKLDAPESNEVELPSRDLLRAGWDPVLERLRSLHQRVGKPIVFTELGYDASLVAALEPWKDGRRGGRERVPAEALQERCLSVALEVLGEEQAWLRGAFLWKWFVGEPSWGDSSFYMDKPRLRAILKERWTD